ncbi:MAG: glycosyltransferase [Chloroflexi bacterium]|nr:glycosyltransferase [Chloroflexota bacterium]
MIITIYNEGQSITRLLDSLAHQTRRPDEIVICDGGSMDDTVAVLHEYIRGGQAQLPSVRVLVAPGANISRGRNVAIAAATGPLIAVTDAGVRLSATWLEHLIAPWQNGQTPVPLAVAGFFLPDIATDERSSFVCAMAATVLPLVEDIDPNKFLPSSRSVAFTKAAWEKSGGYPEWLDYSEDLIFDFAINAQQPQKPTAFAWAPQAVAYFRPRENLRSFWTQYYRYARGDGKADLWRKRHLIRYITYGVLLPALLGHLVWGLFARWLGWVGLFVGFIIYCRRPWQRLRMLGRPLSAKQRIVAALWVPIIRVVGDIAKMAGYPVGLWWRWRHRHNRTIDWRQQ